MFIKFCEKKYNIAEGCNTVSLGTLDYYANDDPNFLKYDYSEGKFQISNLGNEVNLTSSESERITGGGLVGGGMQLESGSNFNRYFSFPNCYIFCFSQNLPPTAEKAKEIDPLYDSWYSISDLNKFISELANYLVKNLKVEDLNICSNVSLDYLKGISVQVVHRPVEIGRKLVELKESNKENVISKGEHPIDWLFLKEEKYKSLNEYRIAFIVLDSFGTQISVKQNNKIINLIPDLGVSRISERKPYNKSSKQAAENGSPS